MTWRLDIKRENGAVTRVEAGPCGMTYGVGFTIEGPADDAAFHARPGDIEVVCVPMSVVELAMRIMRDGEPSGLDEVYFTPKGSE